MKLLALRVKITLARLTTRGVATNVMRDMGSTKTTRSQTSWLGKETSIRRKYKGNAGNYS